MLCTCRRGGAAAGSQQGWRCRLELMRLAAGAGSQARVPAACGWPNSASVPRSGNARPGHMPPNRHSLPKMRRYRAPAAHAAVLGARGARQAAGAALFLRVPQPVRRVQRSVRSGGGGRHGARVCQAGSKEEGQAEQRDNAACVPASMGAAGPSGAGRSTAVRTVANDILCRYWCRVRSHWNHAPQADALVGETESTSPSSRLLAGRDTRRSVAAHLCQAGRPGRGSMGKTVQQ